jgi:hypothetical protein
MNKTIIQKSGRYYTIEEKHRIIQELISTRCTKTEIWKKYTGKEDHGHLLRWMKELGYSTDIKTRRRNIVSNLYPLAHKKIQSDNPVNNENISFENLQLKNRIADLEKQLKDAELKAIAFSTMVDIAEKEFKIPIRKKYTTKP